MLTLAGVSKRVNSTWLLADIDFTIGAGQLVTVLGPTGSGKTSLLRVIMGLDAISSGEIGFDGQILSRTGAMPVPAHERGFSLVFQETLLLPFWSVKQNVLVGGDFNQRAEDRDRLGKTERFSVICSLLGLGELLDRSVHGLSGGEQQRVAVARSLWVEPRLLLLDEPFSNLDRVFRAALWPALQDYLKERGITTVLVTHDREEALAFGERVLLLKAGRLRRQDPPATVYRAPEDRWQAEVLGPCNFMTPAQARSWLGYAATSDAPMLAIRPEQIELSQNAPNNGTLVACEHRGFYHALWFAVSDQVQLRITALSDVDFEIGKAYTARLKPTSQPIELA